MSYGQEMKMLQQRCLARNLREITQGYPQLPSEIHILTCLLEAMERSRTEELAGVVDKFLAKAEA